MLPTRGSTKERWNMAHHHGSLSPHGSSVNDYSSKDTYTLHYATFDQALALVSRHSQNALMAKLDIKHAFRLCPVHPADWELVGIHWEGQYSIDLHLPFGFHSSPYLFNRLAYAFEWILKNNYMITDLMHYLDDNFTVGPSNSKTCADNVNTIIHMASHLGIPLAPEKLEGLTTSLISLGILIDVTHMETALPDDKLKELLAELRSWSSRKKCLKHELLSPMGKLNFACCVIHAGCIFVRPLIDLSTTARLPHHHITMSLDARHDIASRVAKIPSRLEWMNDYS